LPILTLKLVAMAKSVEPSKQNGPNRQSAIKYLPYCEYFVKIGLVNPEIVLLKGSLKINKKKINTSKTQSLHAAQAK